MTSRDLGAQVPQYLFWYPDVFLDHFENGVVDLAPVIELDQGNPQSLLVDLGRMHSRAAGRDAADVSGMDKSRRIALQPVLEEDRLGDVNVRQMHPATAVGVVGNEQVSRVHLPLVLLGQYPHGERKRAHMQRRHKALRHHATLAVADRCRVIQGVPADRRMGATHDD